MNSVAPSIQSGQLRLCRRPSPTSELVAVVSGDHVRQSAAILPISAARCSKVRVSATIVAGEVTGFGIAQVDVRRSSSDLGLLFLNLCGHEVNIAIGVLDISIGQRVASLQDNARGIASPSIVALGQSRGDNFRVELAVRTWVRYGV